MKKINYMAPEMEVIELASNVDMLVMSGGDPDIHNETPEFEGIEL